MTIDLIYVIIVVIAVFKGIQRGFIIAIFSVLAIIVGLAAAIKLSAAAAIYLSESVAVSSKWLPFLSFILVFLLVVLAVRLGANLLQKAVQIAYLGWLNRLAGAVVYVLLYTIVYSVLLFYAEQLHLLGQNTTTGSKVFSWVKPIGPYVVNGLGKVIPFFENMFHELQQFFEGVSKQLPGK